MEKQYGFFNIRDNVVIDGVLYRVLDVVADPDHPDSGTVFCIEMKNPRIKIQKYSMEEFTALYESGKLTVRETDEMPVPTEANEEDRELMARRKEAIDEALALIYPDYDAFEHRKGKEVIEHICDKLVVSDSSARSLLNRYMKSGLNEYSLMDMRQGWNQADNGSAVVNGRKNADGSHSKVVLNDETLNNFEMAFRYFKENAGSGVNLSDAYIYLIDMFYTDEDTLERLPEDECPSYRRFRSYVEKKLEGTSIRDFVKEERAKYKALPESEKKNTAIPQIINETEEMQVVPEEYSDLLNQEDLAMDAQSEATASPETDVSPEEVAVQEETVNEEENASSDSGVREMPGLTFAEGEEAMEPGLSEEEKVSAFAPEETFDAAEEETGPVAAAEEETEPVAAAEEETEPTAVAEEETPAEEETASVSAAESVEGDAQQAPVPEAVVSEESAPEGSVSESDPLQEINSLEAEEIEVPLDTEIEFDSFTGENEEKAGTDEKADSDIEAAEADSEDTAEPEKKEHQRSRKLSAKEKRDAKKAKQKAEREKRIQAKIEKENKQEEDKAEGSSVDDAAGQEETAAKKTEKAESGKEKISPKLIAVLGALAAAFVLLLVLVLGGGKNSTEQGTTTLAAETTAEVQAQIETTAAPTTSAVVEETSPAEIPEETTTFEVTTEAETTPVAESSVEVTVAPESTAAAPTEAETTAPPETTVAETTVPEAEPTQETAPVAEKPAETRPAETAAADSSNVTTEAQKAAARSSRYLRITGDYVNIRDSVTREPIRSYPKGTILEQVGESNDPDWLLVNVSGQNVYISADYVVAADGDTHKQYYRLTGDRVNVRDSADRSEIITQLPKGMVIEQTGSYSNDQWIRFRYEGRNVVMYAEFLEAVDESSAAPKQNAAVTTAKTSAPGSSSASSAGNYYELTGDHVNVRDAVNQETILGNYPQGTILEATGAVSDGFLPVSVGGKNAVVSADYVQQVSTASLGTLYRTTEESSYVYALDKTTVLTSLPSNIIIEETGSDTDWVQFRWDGKNAVISRDVLQEIE